MNNLDFSFEMTPWEATLASLHSGDRLSAVRYLTLLEDEEEDGVEQAFEDLQYIGAELSIEDLPPAPGTGPAAVRLRQEQQLVEKNRLETDLDPDDPLRVYLQEVSDLSGEDSLVSRWLPEVVAQAKTLTGRGVLLMDLIQEGSLGLWEAVQNEQEDRLEAAIRRAMIRTVVLQARAGGILERMHQAAEDYRMVDEKLLGELGRNPTLEEIAQELHMSPEEAATVKKAMDDARIVNQAKNAGKPEQKEDPDEDQAVEDTAYFKSRERIMDLLSGLCAEDAKLLTLRFGLEGGLPMTPEDAGRVLGLTPDEVVTREAAVLASLRNIGGTK